MPVLPLREPPPPPIKIGPLTVAAVTATVAAFGLQVGAHQWVPAVCSAGLALGLIVLVGYTPRLADWLWRRMLRRYEGNDTEE